MAELLVSVLFVVKVVAREAVRVSLLCGDNCGWVRREAASSFARAEPEAVGVCKVLLLGFDDRVGCEAVLELCDCGGAPERVCCCCCCRPAVGVGLLDMGGVLSPGGGEGEKNSSACRGGDMIPEGRSGRGD